MSLNLGEKRLLKDVIDINKTPLHDHGIYYIHDDEDIKKGYALIFGPSDTIYSYGIYFFKFKFPNDYPYSPPRVEYLTNGDNVRFNPNLYRNGKVCISILNTWNGPQWSSCQTISSVLLTLVTLFHNKPLLNEPGINESYPSFKLYNKIIKYSSIKIALLDVLSGKICKDMYSKFKTVIDKYVVKNHESIIEKIKDIDPPKKTINTVQNTETVSHDSHYKTFKVNIYNMAIKCYFDGYLLSRFINLSKLN
tara:strand:+ start:2982 stop:3731 length:750 start_codon:yes stop_codon:yes gene_type:complete